MLDYIKIVMMTAILIAISSCYYGDKDLADFQSAQNQDQHSINDNSNLDKFVDVVEPFNETEAEKSSFYKDSNTLTP